MQLKKHLLNIFLHNNIRKRDASTETPDFTIFIHRTPILSSFECTARACARRKHK
jgi:hypothetical protein